MRCIIGVNDISSQRPDIAELWDKSNLYAPSEVAVSSHKDIWLQCAKHGGSYKIEAANATKGVGCGVCNGKQVLAGYNDLKTRYPLLASEWDENKNIISSSEVASHSNKKYWWVCNGKHSWESTVYNRHTNGCPYCAGKLVIPGYNDLFTLFPGVCDQWDYDRNILNPSDLLPYSNKKVYWICPKNHSSYVSVSKRTLGRECYRCSLGPTSKQEKSISIFLREYLEIPLRDETIKLQWRSVSFMHVDMKYDNLVIEFDGSYWHRDKMEIDYDKSISLLLAGFEVIRLRENPLPTLNIDHKNYFELFLPQGNQLGMNSPLLKIKEIPILYKYTVNKEMKL